MIVLRAALFSARFASSGTLAPPEGGRGPKAEGVRVRRRKGSPKAEGVSPKAEGSAEGGRGQSVHTCRKGLTGTRRGKTLSPGNGVSFRIENLPVQTGEEITLLAGENDDKQEGVSKKGSVRAYVQKQQSENLDILEPMIESRTEMIFTRNTKQGKAGRGQSGRGAGRRSVHAALRSSRIYRGRVSRHVPRGSAGGYLPRGRGSGAFSGDAGGDGNVGTGSALNGIKLRPFFRVNAPRADPKLLLT